MSSPSSTTSAPSPTNSDHSGSDSGSSPTSSPLLFFVALGFGVVFTNLWIIVGVKYCFRYNQRNRQLRNEETGEPIDLVSIPRPHRRRREKRLMTMDEVNDRFPLTKYKTWRSSRADDGLPTAGGIWAWDSASQSFKDKDVTLSVAADIPCSGLNSQECRPDMSTSQPAIAELTELKQSRSEDRTERDLPLAAQEIPDPITGSNTIITKTSGLDNNSEYLGHDIQPQTGTSAPFELLSDPGDSCAICLDAIEDDDDIRGLACGHAFHASCVDPWLTCRKACCPLCKADYYIPKSRPDPSTPITNPERIGHRTPSRAPVVNPPEAVFMGGRVSGNRGGFSLTIRHNSPGRANQSRPAALRFWRWQNPESTGGELGSGGESNNHGQRAWRPRMLLPRSFQFPTLLRSNQRHGPREDHTLNELESGNLRRGVS